ncbi:TIGR03619 family F420-dependent LLM class oxidoreductase [Parahaliea maris]|uniref:TIGR03619 family F420-dependent LLM class oxidoreductase n=1 Tax=Parahaliea maris TaxID=2716870 RepID=A0A5C8ZYB4_9GAMM|nr:TIGR03619 family F420-dependent LLM class oxidoreductase [Parahaliea maris]TXS92704.1 TIGR03619 family F420-dependent LLM class oxidoreductase [Parahaliea maris]
MKFWQSVTWMEAEQLVPVARFAEELGFEGVLNADHAVYPEEVKAPYPYSDNGKPPMTAADPYPDCWVSLAFMAAATTRLRFSTSVYVLPLRNPFEVAKAAGALSLFSGERFALGVGAGWMKDEFDIYGVEFRARGRRMDEMIEIMQALWRGGMVEHHGEFYDFPRLQIEPPPPAPVPVWVGGANPAALRRAAVLGDGWIGAGNTLAEVPPLLQRLAALRAEAGREQEPFETLVGLTEPATPDDYRRLGQQGMTAGVVPPFYFTLGKRSSLDDKKRAMEAFARRYIER